MSLYEIDHAATQRRIDAAAASGMRALAETARGSEELDKQARAMLERRERDTQVMDERIAAARAKPAPDPEPPTRTPSTPATLSLGADELREARAAEQAKPDAGDAAALGTGAQDQRPGTSQTESGRPGPKTLKLGASEGREATSDPKPAPTPHPRPSTEDGDDDMSSRTWLR